MSVDIQALKQKAQAAAQRLASKEGELKRLREESDKLQQELVEHGVANVAEAEAKIVELREQIATWEQETQVLLQQAQDVLDGKAEPAAAATVEDDDL